MDSNIYENLVELLSTEEKLIINRKYQTQTQPPVAMNGKSSTSLSASRLAQAQTIVVKVGSNLLVDSASGCLRQNWLASLIDDLVDWHCEGKRLILVSSGAVALGRNLLKLSARQSSLEHAQAAAAVGQIRLSQAYQQELGKHGIVAAQVLLTLEVGQHRQRYLHSRATIAQLLEMRCVPVINENDTVATDEICFGDNDRLAAQVAALATADVLILLSDVDGLYDRDPRSDADARHIDFVNELTPDIMAMGGGVGTSLAKGGMKAKLLAARIAMRAGLRHGHYAWPGEESFKRAATGSSMYLVCHSGRSENRSQTVDWQHAGFRQTVH